MLPASCQLSYDNSTDASLLALIEKVPEDLWGARLALRLLYERAKGPSSPFSGYISMLPVGVEGIPMFFKPEAVKELQYPPVTEQVRQRRPF